MAPLPPVITQTVPPTATPAINAPVASIATDPAEVDPGPFTYTLVTDDGGNFTSTGAIISTTIGGLTGTHPVGAVVTGTTGVSEEGIKTLRFGDVAPAVADDHAGNPQIPAPLPEGATAWPPDLFLRQATKLVVLRARDGVDFGVARASRTDPFTNVYWDDAKLGPRPTAEIEALAQQLADETPFWS